MTTGANRFLRIYYGKVKEYLVFFPEWRIPHPFRSADNGGLFAVPEIQSTMNLENFSSSYWLFIYRLNMIQSDPTLGLTLLFYQKGYNRYILLYFQSILYLLSTDYPMLIFPPILFDHRQHLLRFNARVCFINPVQKCGDAYYTLIEIV